MPRAKKPASLKVISGTDQPCRRDEDGVEIPALDEVPEAPDWLPNAHAVKEFDRLAQILHANKLLTEAGVMALAHLCALHGKIVQLYAAGESPTANLVSQYRNLINDFGLTPVAQGKVKSGGETKAGNKFANNGRRKTS